MDLGDIDLQPLRVLGQGTFGRVFLCRCRNGKQVCVKRIIMHDPKIGMKMIQEEVYIISQLHHPNIVQFIRSFEHAGTINIVMEYMSNGTMRDVINRYHVTGLPKQRILRFLLDMLMGLEYLHIRHVTHRDIKPENLLLDKHEHIKYGDFGIAGIQTSEKELLKIAGSPLYSAPEVLRSEKYDYKSDIWSLGCVLYEMCIGHNPFQQAANLSDLRFLIKVLTREKLDCNVIKAIHGEVLSSLCQQMLTYNLHRRISLPEVICTDKSITIPFYKQYFHYEY